MSVTPDPDQPCPHNDLRVAAETHLIQEPSDVAPLGVLVDVRAWCALCDEPIVWRPGPTGPQAPRLAPDGQLLQVPGRFANQPVDAAPQLWVPGGR
jgi:hypothetical protein